MREPNWRRYLRFWRPNIAADVDDELRFHFDERIEALVTSGLTRGEARREAEREFGDVTAVRRGLREIDERVRSSRERADFWDRWRQDVTHALRSLRRAPGLTITVVLTLALGIGLNATLFSLLDRVFLRMPAGIARPDEVRRLYWIGTSPNNESIAIPEVSIPIADGIADALHGMALTTVYRNDTKRLGDESQANTVVTEVGPRYFSVLGVQPAFGRFFAPEEERIDIPTPVAVVSQAFWRRRFGGSLADALGQTIILDKQRVTIVGVAPPNFTGAELDATDVWVPLGMVSAFRIFVFESPKPWYTWPSLYGFWLVARPVNASPTQLEAAATAGARRNFTNARLRKNAKVVSEPLIAAWGPEPQQQELSISIRLGGVAIIVLFIACANVANLLLAHATRRRREIAIRAALGISRAGIMRLLLAESVLLAVGAGIMAFVVASWSSVLFRRLLFPSVHFTTRVIDWRVAAFTLLITLLAGMAAGLLPALRATRSDVSQTLKSGGREGSVHRSRMRVFLLVTQAALSTVLLVGAVLFVKSLRAVRALDLGYDVRRLVFVSTHHESASREAVDAALRTGLPQLAAGLARLPDVEGVTLTSMLPMYEIDISTLYYANGDSLPRWTDGAPTVIGVAPEFFRTTGLRIVRGRGLTASDVASGDAALVNETLARSTWPHGDALGQCLRMGKAGRCRTVIGIVQDARRAQLIESPVRQMYVTMRRQVTTRRGAFSFAYSPERAATVEVAAKRDIAGIFPGAEPRVQRMADLLEPQYRPWELGATLFSIFGILALLVAAVGVFSTLSHEMSQRRHELGVRLALGATARDVLQLVVGDGVRVVLAGALAGALLALATGPLIASLLYGVAPRDAGALTTVIIILLIVAALASAIPAWRASRTDPLEALRAD